MKLIATTFYGLEEVLEKELHDLGINNTQKLNRAVAFEGSLEDLYKANYWLRTAIRVLYPVKECRIKNGDDLYKQALKISWENYFGIEKTFAVNGVIYGKLFKHTNYPVLKLKDAIADRFRKKYHKRPDVNTQNPDIAINLYIKENQCVISLDSSGEPLFKRGYRKHTGLAPLNESLAAGLVLLSGWDKQTPFADFMCGSGTIPIEAYLIGTNTPPQILRKNYAFKHWLNFNDILWKKIIVSSKKISKFPKFIIFANDFDKNVIKFFVKNLQSFPNIRHEKFVISNIDFRQLDFRDRKYLAIINPPYGQRLKNEKNFYKEIGDFLKQKFAKGSEVWIFTADLKGLKQLGLKTKKRLILFNGNLEARFVKIPIF